MRGWKRLVVLLGLVGLLSGCMYPNELRKENQLASGEYVVLVQNAVDQFKTKTGVLPIKNSEEATPLYEKYPIDFKKLQGRFLSAVPANAFESGGTAIYVLVDVETKPTVKMLDLTSFQQALDLQQAVNEYRSKHAALPAGERVAQGFYTIDFAKLNRKPADARSVYTPQVRLPFLLHDSGTVTIDYAPEIMRLIDRKQLQSKLTAEQDLRALLVEESYFVPARSFAYRWAGGLPEPITAP
ncbi:hypothetical protein SAMN02799630_00439 [Paenibacillus sp. UNCCL117]|uniref:hypothetical protein n=1 Tax=unclassified Paenibacillus TaxID=185978 RepID=UPI00088C6653|nr:MULTISPECIES: hypothetical protein [unclassified Paenibacillus]SDC40108.1 hypothetical protein SAMN04488602_10293 [Paenibacillus sp. cl123]SFW13894.1 hypothetical protein SAMN02799630_00439 [Paenibacillus sp. UNCCL117]